MISMDRDFYNDATPSPGSGPNKLIQYEPFLGRSKWIEDARSASDALLVSLRRSNMKDYETPKPGFMDSMNSMFNLGV